MKSEIMWYLLPPQSKDGFKDLQFNVAKLFLFTICGLVDGMIAQSALKSNSPIEFGPVKRLIKMGGWSRFCGLRTDYVKHGQHIQRGDDQLADSQRHAITHKSHE